MKVVLKSMLGLAIGIFLSLMLAALAGESSLGVLGILVRSAFGSADDLAMTLFYSTSLMFTGLSVALSFRAGLFNIGAEGQLTIGTLGGLATALLIQNFFAAPSWLALIISTFSCFLFGALWGAVPAILKAYRGSHEVIVTMMMNFVAAGAASYFIVGPLKNPESQNPESSLLLESFHFVNWDPVHSLFPNSMVNCTLVLAILLCCLWWWILKSTRLGFEWRVFGMNPSACALHGISPIKMILVALSVSGGLAGLVGLNEVFASSGKFRLGFSPDYGFIGIAVALTARNHPLGVILAAFLFGALQKGAGDLDLETTRINRDFAKVIQATIVLAVIASHSVTSERFKFWLIKLVGRDRRGVGE